MNYLLIIDSIVRIKNGYMAKQRSVKVRRSKHVIDMLSILYNYNYILGFNFKDMLNIIVFLKYKAEDPLFNLIDNFKIMSGLRRPFFFKFFNLISRFNKSLIILNTVKGLNSNFNLIKLNRDNYYNNYNSKLHNLYFLDKNNINYFNTFSFFKSDLLKFDFYYYFNINRVFYFNNFNLKYNNLILLFNNKYLKENFIHNENKLNFSKNKSKYNLFLDFVFLFFFSLFNSLKNVDSFFFNFFIKNLFFDNSKNPYSFIFKLKKLNKENQFNFDYLLIFLNNFFILNSKRRFLYSKFLKVSKQNILLESMDKSIMYRYFFFNKLDYSSNIVGSSNFYFFSKFFSYFLNCDLDDKIFLKNRKEKIKKNFKNLKIFFKYYNNNILELKNIGDLFLKNTKKHFLKYSLTFLDFIFSKNIKKFYKIISKDFLNNFSNNLFNYYFLQYDKKKNNYKVNLNFFILKNSKIFNNLDNIYKQNKDYYINLNKYKQWLNIKSIISKKNNKYIFFNDLFLLNFYYNKNKSINYKKKIFIKNKLL